MNSTVNWRRSGKHVAVLTAALIVSIIIFAFLSEAFAMCFASPGYYGRWEEANRSKIEELQEYISDGELTVMEAAENTEKIRKDIGFNVILSANADATFLGNHDAWKVRGIPVKCSDGYVYAYAGHSKSAPQIAAFSVATGSFLLITIPYTCKTIQRVMVMSRKPDGNAADNMTLYQEGLYSDEGALIDAGIENMRLASASQLDKKSNDVDLSSKLLTSLAHDIRTPLTRLIGYLDILRYKKFNETDEFDRYITRAAKNAEELKLLTDELFTKVKPHGTLTGEELKGIITDSCSGLKELGFEVDLYWSGTDFEAGISSLHAQRIIDNLSSNIERYADADRPVTVSVKPGSAETEIDFKNYAADADYKEGTGIGLAAVKMLAEESGGSFNVVRTPDSFEAKVYLPIKKA